jgi:uncharacterized protein
VVVEGVVTARFPGLGGFFLQSAAGSDDGDPETSEGLFVRHQPLAGDPPTPGDRVRIQGVVLEVGEAPPTLTTLDAREVTRLRTGGGLAVDTVFLRGPVDDAGAWRRYESMLVHLEGPLTVTGQAGLFRFGELHLSLENRLFQPTELHPPGPEADALAHRNARALVVLDDGDLEQNPRTIGYLPDLPDDVAPLRAGSEVGPLTGVVDVRRFGYLVLPVAPLRVRAQASRPGPPAVAPGRTDVLRVGVLNVENLFNGDGRGGGFPTPRGAETPEAYLLQQAKLVTTLQALELDVVALSELENDGTGPDTALRQFVDALNAAGPVRDWRAVEVAGPGTDAIRTALIYRSGRVAPVGAPVTPLDPGIDPEVAAPFRWGSRPPLGQAFALLGEQVGTGTLGAPWLVVSNHLKSKGGCPEPGDTRAAPGDADQGDHQGCWNAHRVAAAHALAEWLSEDPAGVGAERTLVVGDLNSYGREDPIRLLEDRGWVDAFRVAGVDRPYSYVYQGLAGRLDHVLVPAARQHDLVGAAIWHANADEAPRFGYAGRPAPPQGGAVTPWRSSDHDVLLVAVQASLRPGPSRGGG